MCQSLLLSLNNLYHSYNLKNMALEVSTMLPQRHDYEFEDNTKTFIQLNLNR